MVRSSDAGHGDDSRVHVHVGDASALTDWVWRVQSEDPGAAVRVVRGRKMRRFAGLYDEVAAAWQFPYYFGENLAALRECLTDLEWIPASRYLLVIRDAVLVVSEEREADLALASVLDVMDEAQRTWAKPVTDGQAWDRPARPMSVVFHAEATDTVPLRARLARCGRTALEGPIPNGPSGDA